MDSGFAVKFGRALRDARLMRKMTQAEMALALGVSRVTLNYWENGTQAPTMAKVFELSQVFSISLDALKSNSEESILSILTNEELEEFKRELKP